MATPVMFKGRFHSHLMADDDHLIISMIGVENYASLPVLSRTVLRKPLEIV